MHFGVDNKEASIQKQSEPLNINYSERVFATLENTINGEVSQQTTFYYHQDKDIIWAEYAGGSIVKGFLVGFVDEECNLQFSYEHINMNKEIRIGQCRRTPEILNTGRLKMHEEWQWLNRDRSKGSSQLIEI